MSILGNMHPSIGLLIALGIGTGLVSWHAAAQSEGYTAAPATGGAVIIVEPRSHPMMRRVLDLFLRRVPSSWKLYVFHGSANRAFALQAAHSWIQDNREVVLRDLGVDNLTPAAYNQLFKTRTFWESIDAEDLLIVQTDAVPCNASRFDLDKFRKFPYIGCAYGDQVGRNTYWGQWGFYGSGGLSFRKRSFALACATRYPPGREPEAEDVTFGECVAAFGGPKPTAQDLLEFCTQNRFGAPSWGAHQIGKQLPETQKGAFYSYCPEAANI